MLKPALGVVMALAISLVAPAIADDSLLPTVTFTPATGAPVSMAVEVADDDEERICGLMHRTSMPADQGMLFVFHGDYFGGFWNRNTLIPLSVAYMTVDGRIIDIVDMAAIQPGESPMTQVPNNRSNLPIRYVIEANQGWFAQYGLGPGDSADVTDAVQQASAAEPEKICRTLGT